MTTIEQQSVNNTPFRQFSTPRPIICIQGLGFVGTAMAVAVANARNDAGEPLYNVIGVDAPTDFGRAKTDSFNKGNMGLHCSDISLAEHYKKAMAYGNLQATTDPEAYAEASIAIVDLPLDVHMTSDGPSVNFAPFLAGIRCLAQHCRSDVLVIVETTVPPGTCTHVVIPEFRRIFRERGLPENAFLLAHSYERVMPGKEYYNSIVNFWRVYSGRDEASAVACRDFLSTVLNVAEYPLRRLGNTTASETAKVLENSYRAMNIAFMDEWGRFAEAAGIDMFEIVDAIRMRPTHSNIRQPGFGVGGYCLTKDPLFPLASCKSFLNLPDLDFPFCRQAVQVNDAMPLHTLELLKNGIGPLKGKHVLLCGVSYRPDVGDTRHSPSEILVRELENAGAQTTCHDPLVPHWGELDKQVFKELPKLDDVQAVVLAVGHPEYAKQDMASWLGDHRPFIVDANNVLTPGQREQLRTLCVHVKYVGRGTNA